MVSAEPRPKLAGAVGAEPATWVDEHGDCLYRYALARVRKPEVAQDLVQETFLSAIRSYDQICRTVLHSELALWNP